MLWFLRAAVLEDAENDFGQWALYAWYGLVELRFRELGVSVTRVARRNRPSLMTDFLTMARLRHRNGATWSMLRRGCVRW